MRSDKGECAKVEKCCVSEGNDSKADSCGRLQGVRRSQAPVQLLRKEGGVSTPMGGRLNRSLASEPGPEPPSVHAGLREGFSKLTFLTNASRGREALKCALPPKIRRQDGRPLIRAWLRVASPSILPRLQATNSQMGGRSTSAATPYVTVMYV